MTEYASCSTCGTRRELDNNGKVKRHNHQRASAHGYITERCPGSGRPPLPRG